ncbi:minor allergen Can f 2-like [Sarcophilus harrisii]|uniref:Lipocalin/cytosolic fatty-acid binding domain-containing protein n=1 Tax=Sarcophilus harrisii TaxID=9305 RepID=G3VM27_SARHA|nr:minor allergen Can f 2-like [Sarcophilus harrisii]
MKILLLTFICGLQALNNDVKELPQLTGEWYTVALASNVSSKIEKGGSLEMYVHKIYYNEDGALCGDFFKEENGECTKFSVRTSQENDRLKVQYDGENDITIQHVDNECAMILLHNVNKNENTIWAELFGRTPYLPDKIKKQFQEMCENAAISKDQIRDLSNEDRCQELR